MPVRHEVNPASMAGYGIAAGAWHTAQVTLPMLVKDNIHGMLDAAVSHSTENCKRNNINNFVEMTPLEIHQSNDVSIPLGLVRLLCCH